MERQVETQPDFWHYNDDESVNSTIGQSRLLPPHLCGATELVIPLPNTIPGEPKSYTRTTLHCPYGTRSPPKSSVLEDCVPMLPKFPVARVSPINASNIPPELAEKWRTSDNSFELLPLDVADVLIDMTFLPDDILYGVHWQLRVLAIINCHKPITLDVPLDFEKVADIRWPIRISISTTRKMRFNVSVEVIHGEAIWITNYLADTWNLEFSDPNRATLETKEAFFTYTTKDIPIELPNNLLQEKNDRWRLSHTSPDWRIPLETEDYNTILVPFENARQAWAQTHLPLFSNCRNFGSYIQLYRLLENPEWCNLVSVEETFPVTSKDFLAKAIGDQCHITLPCRFESPLDETKVRPYWHTMVDPDSVLFYIGSIPHDRMKVNESRSGLEAFFSGDNIIEGVGRDIIPVKLIRDDPLALYATKEFIPRKVALNIQYRQRTETTKVIIMASVTLSQFDLEVTRNEYDLTITYVPMNYTDIVDAFGFDEMGYIFLFSLISIVQLVLLVGLYILQWILSRYKTYFRIFKYTYMTAKSPFIATLYIFVPLTTVLLMLWAMLNYDPMTKDGAEYGHSEDVQANWLDDPRYIPEEYMSIPWPERKRMWRGGRTGTAMIAVGFYMILNSIAAFISHRSSKELKKASMKNLDMREKADSEEESNASEVDETELKKRKLEDVERKIKEMAEEDKMFLRKHDERWNPINWKRVYFGIYSLLLCTVSVFTMEFAFSDWVRQNMIAFAIFFKLMTILISKHISKQFKDDLLVAPLIVFMQVLLFMVIMAADLFTSFLASYMMMFLIDVIFNMFWDPFFAFVENSTIWQTLKGMIMIWRKKKLTDEERIRRQAESMDPLIQSFAAQSHIIATQFLIPFLLLILWIFEENTLIIQEYFKIRTGDWRDGELGDLMYYVAFVVFALVTNCLCSVVVLNTIEVSRGWRIYAYIVYSHYRFRSRQTRWVGSQESTDMAMSPEHRNLHNFCWSSQFYFAIMIHVVAMLMIAFGIECYIHQNYAFISDNLFIPLMFAAIFFCFVMKHICLFVSNMLKIWVLGTRPPAIAEAELWNLPETTPMERIAEKKKKFREEYAKIETPRVTTKLFRAEFMKKNRNFIGDHLGDLLTPRQIKRNGDMLLSMFQRLLGDRDDSTEEESDSGPHVGGMSWHAVCVAKTLIAAAKFRMKLRKKAEDEMLSRQPRYCDICGSQENVEIKPRKDITRYLDDFQRVYMFETRKNPFSPKIFMKPSSNLKEPSQKDMIHAKWDEYWATKVEFSCRCGKHQQSGELTEEQKRWMKVAVKPISDRTKVVMQGLLRMVRSKLKVEIPTQQEGEPDEIIEEKLDEVEETDAVRDVKAEISSSSGEEEIEASPEMRRESLAVPASPSERSNEIADIEDLISSDDSSSESSAHVAPDLDDSAIQIMRVWFRIAKEQEIREMNEHLSDAS